MEFSQVQRSLVEEMSGMDIIDTHEHLPGEAERLQQRVDFATLFSHYCRADLVSAGMSEQAYLRFTSPGLSPAEKWELFSSYYRRITAGSYCRAAHLAMERFYGIPRLSTLADAEALSQKVREANQPGLYRRVLKEACRITTSVNFGSMSDDREFFAPVLFATHLTEIATLPELEAVGRETGAATTSLSRYVDGLAAYLARQQQEGLHGIKFHYAYMRPLRFEPVDTAAAERVFNRISDESRGWRPHVLGYEEARPLQDHLVHRLVEIAGDLDLVVVFHTGLQADNFNDLENTRPAPLWNLFRRYPRTRFNLLHGGIPFVDEAGLLAKYFPNVVLDMAWMHVISPELSRRALRAWLELVPRNKVLGFGGDYCVVEKVYGHLVLARENIASVLAERVAEGAMSRAQASAWVRGLLWDNPREVYRLA
jgi:predicted TIM-barrel fold metal-dependent hydrolase